eukprot:TRINITY_DN1734_c0_g1_i1.p1 TRINITY_DN1734_c0_g1~~TRINITY_DN1734_c0_g1_i1.p1  ORF type:complete len:151 (+),score=44.20 TRINITY_DN1734_c0_g1_i1:95-547(+)
MRNWGRNEGGGATAKSRNFNRPRKVLWDEENLEYWEKHRSATQKINEPKTPYHRPIDHEMDEDGEGQQNSGSDSEFKVEMARAHAEAIANALSEVAGSSGGSIHGGNYSRNSSIGWNSSEDEIDFMEDHKNDGNDGDYDDDSSRGGGWMA